AKIEIEHGYINATCENLKGAKIRFEKVSVGATANAIMVSVLADGITNLHNVAKEPEISSLIDYLVLMGAKIEGKNTSHLQITGVKKMHPVETEMMPDRIEAGTFLIAGAITGSRISISNCIPEHIQSLLDRLIQTGCKLNISKRKVEIIPPAMILPVDIVTYPYPDFPTDLQAQFMALMTLAKGESRIKDTIFPDRFMHVAELNRLDADISLEKHVAIVNGVNTLSGAMVMATDLRASAALVLAGLAAKGETTISRIYHIDRGYDKIEVKLQKLGADIKRIKG
ncbi:MAG: UDP-N-acetylglucosamine 1-carboxyvinyltransferase, partial [Candidatus Cloacimonetes bacterium]|nr:UDP-N-acetylglucosamine 1-carboxyvinyltransferase [Candidatus Cloacimonadota bacterium]